MSKVLIILDRQHSGKPMNIGDLGAWGDFDHDGKPDMDEMEAMVTARYLLSMEMWLRRMNYDVYPISDGAYYDRHIRAKQAARDYKTAVYIAAHCNSGGGRYGSVFHDFRSPYGESLAGSIGDSIKVMLPELGGDVRVLSTSHEGWKSRAHNTIKGVYDGVPTGICFEPLFLDCKQHATILTDDGLDRVGESAAVGIDTWVGSR